MHPYGNNKRDSCDQDFDHRRAQPWYALKCVNGVVLNTFIDVYRTVTFDVAAQGQKSRLLFPSRATDSSSSNALRVSETKMALGPRITGIG